MEKMFAVGRKRTKEPWETPIVRNRWRKNQGQGMKQKSISLEGGALEIKGEVSFRKEGKVTRDKNYKKKSTKIRLEKQYCSSVALYVCNLLRSSATSNTLLGSFLSHGNY
jgi:hypothetical protein